MELLSLCEKVMLSLALDFNNRKDQVTVKVHKKMTLVKGIIDGRYLLEY
jgi:hypothetical protein